MGKTPPMLTPEDIEQLVDNAPKCQAANSQIHGCGLFAKKKIEKGECVIDFSDPLLYVEKKFSDLEEWRLIGGKYTALNEDICVISERFTKYSLLNHSRNPNAATNLSERRVIALRDIEPEEEITVDYRHEPVPPEVSKYMESWL